MKRWTVHREIWDSDEDDSFVATFVAAFDTEQDALDYVKNTPFVLLEVIDAHAHLENYQMSIMELLKQDSPSVPTPEDRERLVAQRRKEEAEREANLTPAERAVRDMFNSLRRSMARDFYGDGS